MTSLSKCCKGRGKIRVEFDDGYTIIACSKCNPEDTTVIIRSDPNYWLMKEIDLSFKRLFQKPESGV